MNLRTVPYTPEEQEQAKIYRPWLQALLREQYASEYEFGNAIVAAEALHQLRAKQVRTPVHADCQRCQEAAYLPLYPAHTPLTAGHPSHCTCNRCF
jgi:hypothetical protein